MRVANRMTDRRTQTIDPGWYGKGIHLVRNGHLVPASRHRPHIDGNLTIAGTRGAQHRSIGLDAKFGCCVIRYHQIGDAAHAVATDTRKRAIMVQDVHTDIGADRGTDHKDLVTAGASAPIRKDARRCFPHGVNTTTAPVEHDEIIPKAVHFQKSRHGQRIRQNRNVEKHATSHMLSYARAHSATLSSELNHCGHMV